MENKALISAASSKFFPSLVNLLSSIKKNYPKSPKIYIYDLGLFWSYRKELEQINNLEVLDMPKFSSFWRSCYTWKTYILSHPLGRLNFYLDAGTQVLKPLDEIFDSIEKDNYFAVGQGVELELITPQEYKTIFSVENKFYSQQCITAGVFGFKQNSTITPVTNKLYQSALAGLALGFSPNDYYRNKGVNKTQFIRNCKIFRHDTTLLSLLMREYFKDFIIQDCDKYAGAYSASDHPQQLIWNLRLNFLKLENLDIKFLHKEVVLIAIFNRLIIRVFLSLRIIRLFLKGKLSGIKNLKKSKQ